MHTFKDIGQNKLQFSIVLSLTAFAAGLAIYNYKFSTGISPDSIQYYFAGSNFLAGKGFFVSDYRNYGSGLIPMTQWPPGYALILAIFSRLFQNLAAAAFALNTISLCITAVLAYLILKFQFRIPTPIALSGLMVLIVARPVLMIHAWAWSEPLFINFVLLSWICLIQYANSNQTPFLALSAIVTSAALLTRFAGISLLLANIVAILFVHNNFRKKIRDILVFISIGIAPLILWFIRNSLLASQLSNRQIAYHPIPLIEFLKMWTDILAWFYPQSNSFPFEYGIPILTVFTALYFIVIGLRFFLKGKSLSPNVSSFPFIVLGIFAVSYLGFIVISRTFIDAYIPLDERILSPFFVCLLIIITTLFGTLLAAIRPGRLQHGLSLFMSLAFLIFFSGEAKINNDWFNSYAKDGLGFEKNTWRQSPTIEELFLLPEDVVIISNAPDAIEFLTGKKSYFYPSLINPTSGLTPENLDEQFFRLQSFVQSHDSVFVAHFIDIARNYLVSEDEMIQRLELLLIENSSEGRIYWAEK